ncbi:alkaline phosphatase family protein [Halomonas urmiana]|uniref:Alkaline phosphatase family protein n=1 Tax=Halomonas urmiana TaxID=490901 RepID=A0A5R8M981_9GAMM|nr:alkaline phosphatase D family protein [Halomonas urmiana]TLF46134.1 alkaline phosphatase family protein [Halomonas urmiana]
MSGLRTPQLGPIVGHTAHDRCRIWVRARASRDEGTQLGAEMRTLGMLGVVDRRGKVQVDEATGLPCAYYFRLHREFDRTGTFVLGQEPSLGGLDGPEPSPLSPDTEYRVRVATLTVDDPLPDAESLDDSDLASRLPALAQMAPLLESLDPTECEARFRTFPDPAAGPADELSFLIGSCRYPGLLWKVKEADRIFGPMAGQMRRQGGRTPARFTLLMGDQIYADKFNRHLPLGRADTFDEMQARYHEAFGAPNMRSLLSQCPVYMILDDHEIEDNWSQDRLRDNHHLFNIAIGAYMSYQWSHGPRSFGRRLFYRFECGGYPFFVVDTRTQRYRQRAGLGDNHLLGRPSLDADPAHKSQLDRLLEWLSHQQAQRGNVPKFLVTASVFAPSPIDERLGNELRDDPERRVLEANLEKREASDSWPAYPRTRRAILQHLHDHGIQNVVFLSGDVHCANIARLRFETEAGESDLVAYDVTSSALYWPFPFADGDPNGFVHDSRADDQYDGFPLAGSDANGQGATEVHYRAWGFSQKDNFCRLELDKARQRLRVRVFDAHGQPVTVSDAEGRMVEHNDLPLAPWD